MAGSVTCIYLFLSTPRALAEDIPRDEIEVACATHFMEVIDPALNNKHNVDNLSYALACDEPSASASDAAAEPDRSGLNLLRQVVAADYDVWIRDDEDLDNDPDEHLHDTNGYVDSEEKDVVIRRSRLLEPDRGVGTVAHEFAHVIDAPQRDAAFNNFSAAVTDLWAKQKIELDKQTEAASKWDKRGAIYKRLPWHQDEKPKKLTDPGTQPELPAATAYRDELVETEVRAFTWAREIAQQLGIPCTANTGTKPASPSAPDDDYCHPVERAELLRQLRDSPYAELFSPDFLKPDLYNPEVWPHRARPREAGSPDAEPNRAVTEVFNAQDDADGIIEGVPATEPGTTDAKGVYTVKWADIDPNRAVTEVFNAQDDADGIIEGVPEAVPGTTDEHGMHTVSWEEIAGQVEAETGFVAPSDQLARDARSTESTAVTELFNAQDDADGIIEGVPEAVPGTTDEHGMHTVSWDEIAGQVEAETGFVAPGDEPAQGDGVTDEMLEEISTENTEPSPSVTEIFNAQDDPDGVIEGIPETAPGTTDADGVYTVKWGDIAPAESSSMDG